MKVDATVRSASPARDAWVDTTSEAPLASLAACFAIQATAVAVACYALAPIAGSDDRMTP
jgi:hypothetical protein